MNEILVTYDLFSQGRYTQCKNLLKELANDINLSVGTQCQNADDHGSIKHIWNCVYRNNSLVCEALEKLLTTDKTCCDEVLSNFGNMFAFYKHADIIPLQLKFNIVYNFLYWYWLKLEHLPDAYHQTLFENINDCLIDVLLICGDTYYRHDLDNSNNIEKLIYLLKRLSNVILQMLPIQSLQLLDIMHISMLLSFEVHCNSDRYAEYTEFCENFIRQVETVMFHIQPENSSTQIQVSSKTGYFKFGYKQINIRLDQNRFRESITPFILTVVLCYMKIGSYDVAKAVLIDAQKFDPKMQHLFIYNYIKAQILLHLNDYQSLVVTLSKLSVMLLEDYFTGRVHLLLTVVAIKYEEYKTALARLKKMKDFSVQHCSNLAIYYKACIHKNLNNRAYQVTYLKQLATNMKKSDNLSYNETITVVKYETRYLNLLHPQPEITKYSAQYILARSLLEHNDFTRATLSYTELLDMLQESHNQNNYGTVVSMPDIKFVYHEAILANFKCGNYDKAKTLAEKCVDSYCAHYMDDVILEPSGKLSCKKRAYSSPTDWDFCLYSFDEDVIALLLFADICQAQNNFQKQMQLINSSYNAILGYTNTDMGPACKKICTNSTHLQTENNPENDQLCRSLMAKTLLRKANLCIRLNMPDECRRSFSKALTFNPGDQDVVRYYRKWLCSINCVEEASKIVVKPQDVNYKLEEYQDFALTYLLECIMNDDILRDQPSPTQMQDDDDEDLLANLYEDYDDLLNNLYED